MLPALTHRIRSLLHAARRRVKRKLPSGGDAHPPMRGWLTVRLIGSDGENYGFIQDSDRLADDFTA